MRFSCRALATTLGVALTLATVASADPISGVLNLAGSAYVSQTQIAFFLDSLGDESGEVRLPDSGIFATLTPGSVVGMKTLNINGGQPVGTPFFYQDWLTTANGISLDLTFINPNSGIPVCNGTQAVCRAIAGSPIVLSQTSTGVSAELDLSGTARMTANAPSATDPAFKALFTTQFVGETIDSLLLEFHNNGFIEASDSGNVITGGSSVPEPGAFALLGMGLVGLALVSRKYAIKRS